MNRTAPRTSNTICISASNSAGLAVRSPVAELLADLAAAFGVLGLPWYLFGAQAAIVYGAARLTADVDVTVQAPPDATPADWLSVLDQHGFDARFTDRAFLEQTRVLPLAHRDTGLPVDVVLGGPGLEDDFMRRAVTRDIDGVTVPVIDVTDLVILKILAGRPKDTEDVVALLQINDGVDEARVIEVLTLLERALGQSDLRPHFERVRAQSRH
jgi:predicted nucleotidyltransferase